MARSLRIVRTLPPGTKSRSIMRVPWPWRIRESAQPPRSACCTSRGSRPAASTSASASATPSSARPTITWFATFAMCPAPGPPTCTTFAPTVSSTGRTRATSSSLPPAMIARVAAAAPSAPPDTGASTQPMPRARRRSARSRLSTGFELPMSSTTWPGRSRGSSCSSTAPTAAESERLSRTTSAAAASSNGRSGMPLVSSSASGDRFHARTSMPAAARLRAIGLPMRPSPRKPTLGCAFTSR